MTIAPTQEEIDARRERIIEDIVFLMLESTDRGERYQLWRLLQQRISERSPEQIERMERQRGLR